MGQPVPPPAARIARILHAALTAGLALAGAVLLFVARTRVTPVAGDSVGLAIAVVAVLLLAVALRVLRPRVPQRPFDQSPDDYWGANVNRLSAIVLWAIVESAGMLGWVGHLLTGALAPAVAGVLAVLGLIALRPSRLAANDG